MFSQDALLLVGHGSSTVPDAARPLMAHAEVIRASGRFAQVAVGLLRGQPDAASALDSLTAPIVHVVPFFLEDGYFTRITIPDLLLPRVTGSRVLRFCRPVGTNEGIVTLLDARLRRHCEMFGIAPKSLSVLLAGHGSSKNPGRARFLRQHATRLEALGRYGWVRIAHLEEPPLISETLASTRGHIVGVLGYLANDGVHASQDLPALIAAERGARGANWPPVHDLGAIGGDAVMPDLIMRQVTALR